MGLKPIHIATIIIIILSIGTVWSPLHIIVKPIIIVLILGISLVLGVAQCEYTITPTSCGQITCENLFRWVLSYHDGN